MKKSKFWFDNEKKVLKKLGYKPCPQSGAGDLYKEDGYNDYSLCQLKSTEKESYKLNLLDIEKLQYNAYVAKKIPVFIIEFLKQTTLICISPEDLDAFIDGYKGHKTTLDTIVEKVYINKKDVVKSSPRHLTEDEAKEETIDTMFEKRKERKAKEKRKPQGGWKRNVKKGVNESSKQNDTKR